MQVLLLFLVVVLAVGLLDAFSRACERAISAFGALLGGWRPDGWPHGVQEEDRTAPWQRGGPPTSDKPKPRVPRPPLSPVRGVVHAR